MKIPELPPDFVAKCKAVTAKRPRTVIEHVLKKGFITTQELKDKYGYNHPPRAIRDVKENGIPMERFPARGTDGRKIAAYRFGDPAKARTGKLSGRTVLNKKLREALVARDGAKCAIYREAWPAAELQIDHRIPFEVSGYNPTKDADPADYMLLSPSANRAKSWSCEHCKNWLEIKDPKICERCYWANPDDYEHVAMQEIRRLDLLWRGESAKEYDTLKKKAQDSNQAMPEFVKDVLSKASKLK